MTLSKDLFRRALIDSTQGSRGNTLSSSIDGRTNTISPDEIPPSNDECVFAWQPTYIKSLGGNDYLTLEPSTVGPTPASGGVKVSGTLITDDPRPELLIPDTPNTTQIVYLKLGGVAEVLTQGFVTAITIATAIIEVSTSTKTSTIGTTSTIYLELFRWRNKELQNQVTKYNVVLFGRGISGSAVFAFNYGAAIA